MQDPRCTLVGRHHDAVVHPLAITPSGHNAGVPQIRQVPGNLRLGLIQDLDEIANADFLVSHEVQKPQAGIVAKCLKESRNIENLLFCCHVTIISALTNVFDQ